MNPIGGAAIGAGLGGLVGAGIWAAVSYGLNIESGWIAWGVGALVGFGAALGSGNRGGMTVGVLAAAIALGSILFGKYLSVEIAFNKVAQKFANVPVSPYEAQCHLADKVVADWEAEGQKLVWPQGKSAEEWSHESDLPPKVWAETQKRWSAMTPEEQESYCTDLRIKNSQAISSALSSIKKDTFFSSFSLFDVLWFGLALFTALRIGGGEELAA